MVAIRHFEFLKYAHFHFPHGLQWQTVCSRKILPRSVERLWGYYKLNIFNMVAIRCTHTQDHPESHIGGQIFAFGSFGSRPNFGGFLVYDPLKVVSYH